MQIIKHDFIINRQVIIEDKYKPIDNTMLVTI